MPPRPAPPATRSAVFIDQDGTLVENVRDNVDPARLVFHPAALEALTALQAAGFALVIASNQSGLARGLFTRWQFAALQLALERRLREEAGVVLTDVVVCPHAPDDHGRPACPCRKPAPGLLLRAARTHGLELTRSWMVGDTLDDVEAGVRAGCRTVLYDSGGETLWRHSPLRRPDATCTDWDEVAHVILSGASPRAWSAAGVEPFEARHGARAAAAGPGGLAAADAHEGPVRHR